MRFYDLLKNGFMRNGYHLERNASKDEILDLIEILKPQPTGHDLIRLGGEDDGGYLVPDDMNKMEVCFSPGVSDVATFEEMLINQYNMKCFLADYSVEKAPVENKNLVFDKKYLGATENEKTIRLEDWVKEHVGSDYMHDMMLQMDIEGAEYEVLIDTPREVLQKFRMLIIEFHALDAIINRTSLKLVSGVFKKLNRDFVVAHAHPNNCRLCKVYEYQGIQIPAVMEFTFLRRDRVTADDRKLTFPHALDRKNVPNLPDSILPKVWQKT